MTKMPIISLPETAKALGESGQRVNVLWQQPDSLVFMARGREYRSEFHINPSDEVMYPVKGDLRLHYRNEDGKEEIATVPEGSVIYTPAGTPPAIVNKLSAELKTIVANAEVRERFYSQGIEPAYAGPEEFAAYIKATVAKYAKIIRDLGLKAE
mgnify:CR=1 FL=1